MRVKCCHCGCRFDVPIRAVLEEAKRITQRPAPSVSSEGNTLSPDDAEGRRSREEAIKRRSSKKI